MSMFSAADGADDGGHDHPELKSFGDTIYAASLMPATPPHPTPHSSPPDPPGVEESRHSHGDNTAVGRAVPRRFLLIHIPRPTQGYTFAPLARPSSSATSSFSGTPPPSPPPAVALLVATTPHPSPGGVPSRGAEREDAAERMRRARLEMLGVRQRPHPLGTPRSGLGGGRATGRSSPTNRTPPPSGGL